MILLFNTLIDYFLCKQKREIISSFGRNNMLTIMLLCYKYTTFTYNCDNSSDK